MPSLIDATKPIAGTPTTDSVRANFAAAKAEIEALQTGKAEKAGSDTQAFSASNLTASGVVTAAGNTKIKATRGTAQSIANVTETIIIFDTEVYDTLAEYDPATGRATISKAGYYHIHGHAMSASTAWPLGTEWGVSIYINGVVVTHGMRTQMAAAAAANLGTQVDADILLTAGDIVDIRIFHNRGAAVDVLNSALHNQFSIHRIP